MYVVYIVYVCALLTVFILTLLLSTSQYPRKAETAFTGDLQCVKEGARVYLSSGNEHLTCSRYC